jgi:hypothetical protein
LSPGDEHASLEHIIIIIFVGGLRIWGSVSVIGARPALSLSLFPSLSLSPSLSPAVSVMSLLGGGGGGSTADACCGGVDE